MRVAIIKDGIVDNVVIYPDGYELGADEVETETANSGDTYEGTTFKSPGLSAEQLKSAIRKAFKSASLEPITVNGNEYNGGIDSALMLDGARRKAERKGDTSVVFYGTGNTPISLTLPEADEVINAVGDAYELLFAKKQALFGDIAAAADQTALDLIKW